MMFHLLVIFFTLLIKVLAVLLADFSMMNAFRYNGLLIALMASLSRNDSSAFSAHFFTSAIHSSP